MADDDAGHVRNGIERSGSAVEGDSQIARARLARRRLRPRRRRRLDTRASSSCHGPSQRSAARLSLPRSEDPQRRCRPRLESRNSFSPNEYPRAIAKESRGACCDGKLTRWNSVDFRPPISLLLLLMALAAGRRSQGRRPPRRSGYIIYNWTDFIGHNTIAEFEKQTGIKVTYDVYDSEETMDARLLAGSSGYDVVIASTEYFGREIKAGVYIPLDKSKLPNWKNLDPRILAIQTVHDPGNAHSVPYMHAINGFAYNVDMIKARMPNAPVDSLDMIFKPEVVAKFADCGVTFLDSAADTLMLALQYLRLDPNTTKPRGLQGGGEPAAEGAALRPLLRFLRIPEWTWRTRRFASPCHGRATMRCPRRGREPWGSTSILRLPCRRKGPTKTSPPC